MEKKLLNLIYSYSIDGEYADKNFFEDLIKIVVSKKQLSDYVKNINFEKKNKKIFEINHSKKLLSSYDPFSKSIELYEEGIDSEINSEREYIFEFSEFENDMAKNLCVAQSVLYELERAYQSKVFDNGSQDEIETALIRNSFYPGKRDLNMEEIYSSLEKTTEYIRNSINERSRYYELYDFNPSERLASINSYSTIKNSLTSIKEEIPNLYSFYSLSVFTEMIYAYAKSRLEDIYPSEKYLSRIGKSEVWESFDFYDKDRNIMLDNATQKHRRIKRLTLGLPISDDEFKVIFETLGGSLR